MISGDWIRLLESDKEAFKIKLTDEQVSTISKQKFKNYVKQKSIELTIMYLEKLKKKNSKSKQLEVSNLETSPYLLDSRFSKEERELLFRLRSKTLSVKENFKNAYLNNNMLCDLCSLFPCTQSHPLQCPKLNQTIIVEEKTILNDNFIYGSVEQQLVYVKIFKHFWELRENLLS